MKTVTEQSMCSQTTGNSYGVHQEFLREYFNMCCVDAMFGSRLSRNVGKQWHLNMCLELQETANKDQTLFLG
jgi:hypothetical protein